MVAPAILDNMLPPYAVARTGACVGVVVGLGDVVGAGDVGIYVVGLAIVRAVVDHLMV